MTPSESDATVVVQSPANATPPAAPSSQASARPRGGPNSLSRRGFSRRKVPSLPLADGAIGEYPFNRWMQFAGVDSTQVGVRGERVLYTAAGIILGGYTVYAFIGVFAFAFMASDSLLAAIIAAVVVGTILISINLSIDRGLIGYVPARLHDADDPQGDRQPLLEDSKVKWSRRLRVLLAILFALAVGEPANLFLFGKDVDAAMVQRDATVTARQREVSNSNYSDQIAAQQVIITAASKRIDEINAAPEDLLKKAEAERAGSGATGETGCGTQCREYLSQADAARSAAPGLVAAEQSKINAANDAINQINATKNKEVGEAGAFSASNNGFLAREQALMAALRHDPMMLLRYLIVVLVFFCLEMGAVLTKYLAKGNNYERESARRARLAEYASVVRSRNERATIAHRDDLNRRMSIEADEHFYAQRSEQYASPHAPERPVTGRVSPYAAAVPDEIDPQVLPRDTLHERLNDESGEDLKS